MAHNLVTYLQSHFASFEDEPLNEVDSLVLCTVAYLNFEEGPMGRKMPNERLSLPEALCGIPRERLYSTEWLKALDGDKFFTALLQSPRFMGLKVAYYTRELSVHFEKQFAAVSFFLPDNSIFVAFRGTDNSIAGWKENFNLTFMEAVPSQQRARTYLQDIASLAPTQLYVAGHSKGGNLAEYASLTCTEDAFNQISLIFNFDGPGFAFPPSDRMNDPAYEEKLCKVVPESSVVGMLLEKRDCPIVVEAQGVLLLQHASTCWTVEGDRLKELDALSTESVLISNTLNGWAASYTRDQAEFLIETLYSLIDATNAGSLAELVTNKTANILAVIEAARNLPDEKREAVISMLADIAPIFENEAVTKVREAIDSMVSGLPKKTSKPLS